MGLHVLILAGGTGSRLWPLSRASTPKHLLPLAPGGETLLRATAERVLQLGGSVRVVTAAEQAGACAAAVDGLSLGPDAVIAEPEARGTGPALGLAVALIAREDPDALVASVHADHRVGDADAYRAAVLAAAGWALATDGLAAVGLVPANPATGFGYIALAAARDAAAWRSPPSGADERLVRDAAALPAFESAGFAEKPSADMARAYVDGGQHLWNLGLFAWPARRFLDEMGAADAALRAGVEEAAEARAEGDEERASRVYSGQRTIAVEPLVLERTPQLTVVRASFGWSDLGSWEDLHDARLQSGEADADGNVIEGDALLVASRGSTVLARGGRLVAVAGVEGLVVVDTPDALLVVPAAESQRVKDLVDRLRAGARRELL